MSGIYYRGNHRLRLSDSFRITVNKFLQYIARKGLLLSKQRVFLQSLRGVSFADRRNVFVGEDVFFDEVFPENISIGKNVLITEGAMILTHNYDPSFNDHVMKVSRVTINDGAFVGVRSIIIGPVTIGEKAVVAAGAVVTKDVPAGEVVAGVPARTIGKRGDMDPSGFGNIVEAKRRSSTASGD